jgi:hypothetical protein
MRAATAACLLLACLAAASAARLPEDLTSIWAPRSTVGGGHGWLGGGGRQARGGRDSVVARSARWRRRRGPGTQQQRPGSHMGPRMHLTHPLLTAVRACQAWAGAAAAARMRSWGDPAPATRHWPLSPPQPSQPALPPPWQQPRMARLMSAAHWLARACCCWGSDRGE